MVWIGTDDGNIQVTTSDGRKWENVTPSAVTAWSRVTMMEASHFDFNTAYAAVDRHQLEDFAPYIYRTRDMGKSWQRITTGLPAEGYVHTVKEDPERQGLLYAGTERGVFVSFDDGDNWHPLRLNLPVTSMRDMEVYNNDLILATHGRGFWVMDDINVLRRVDPKLLASEAVLFKPNDAIFYAGGSDYGTPLQKDEPRAENAPNGAAIDYYLGARPNGPVTLEILDAKGEVVHTFTDAPSVAEQADGERRGDGKIPNTSALWRPEPVPFAVEPGMHRVVWVPVKEAPRGGGGGGFRRRRTPLLGTFTARLTVNGKSSSESFTVKPDPRVSEMTADDEGGDDDKY
jgi:hypothetical protein